MGEVDRLLRLMEAPDPLVEWSRDKTFEDVWERCTDAIGLVWVWGAGGLSLNAAVLAVRDAVRDVEVAEAKSIVEHVLDIASACVDRRATREDCEQAAQEAEQAAQNAKATFRQTMPDGYSPIVLASAWVARAAEGLMTARLRAEAARMQQAQQTASYLGAGVNILVENEPPIRLAAERIPDDPFHGELLYVVAALAEAVSNVVRARIALGETEAESHQRVGDQLRVAA